MTKHSHIPYFLRIAALVVAIAMPAIHAVAQRYGDTREVTNAQILAIGANNTLDTYLSPEEHEGIELRYMSHTLRHTPGKQWRQRIIHQAYLANTLDRSEDDELMGGLYSLDCAMMRQWDLADGKVELMAGGMIDFNIGATYSSRNQNNPAQLRLGAAIGPTASAAWKINMLKTRWRLGCEVAVPVVGMTFMPNYGQSYYEIFSRGEYDHNVVVTTPFNSPSMRHMLTLDAKLGSVTLRVGYLGDIVQLKANNLKQHYYTNAFMIGFVKHVKITEIR